MVVTNTTKQNNLIGNNKPQNHSTSLSPLGFSFAEIQRLCNFYIFQTTEYNFWMGEMRELTVTSKHYCAARKYGT